MFATPRWAHAHGHDAFGAWAAFTVAGVTQRLRWIPPGVAVMGSPEHEHGRAELEGPPRAVEVAEGFWLGETPVTEALWSAVREAPPPWVVGPRRPVTCVSWNEAHDFLSALSDRVPSLLPRLPLEHEWEHACRAGTTAATWRGEHTPDGLSLVDIGWSRENTDGAPRDVATCAPNPWGLFDMLGNVWEWCDGAYAPWRAKPRRVTAKTKPVPPEKTPRPIRGGGWQNRAHALRAAARGAFLPDVRSASVGLRVAASSPGDAPPR